MRSKQIGKGIALIYPQNFRSSRQPENGLLPIGPRDQTIANEARDDTTQPCLISVAIPILQLRAELGESKHSISSQSAQRRHHTTAIIAIGTAEALCRWLFVRSLFWRIRGIRCR